MADENSPYWVRNRDTFILYACGLLLGVVVWSVPDGLKEVQAEHKSLAEEHRSVLKVLEVQCVHAAKTRIQLTECLTLTVLPSTLEQAHATHP